MTTHRPNKQHTYDVLVVGCGGWGLAVLKVLQELGIDVLGIERGEICHNLDEGLVEDPDNLRNTCLPCSQEATAKP